MYVGLFLGMFISVCQSFLERLFLCVWVFSWAFFSLWVRRFMDIFLSVCGLMIPNKSLTRRVFLVGWQYFNINCIAISSWLSLQFSRIYSTSLNDNFIWHDLQLIIYTATINQILMVYSYQIVQQKLSKIWIKITNCQNNKNCCREIASEMRKKLPNNGSIYNFNYNKEKYSVSSIRTFS